MSDPIISLFIDDELDLNGKIELVENIYLIPVRLRMRQLDF